MARHVFLTFVLAAVPGFGQVVSYEATAFPEQTADGWLRYDFINLADRWLEEGWLVQACVLLKCPPDCTTQDFYRRELPDQAGFTSWFLAWRMVTDGPEAYSAVAPASIVAGGTSGITYHFTIARDEMRFLRDVQLPLVFADFDEGVPHVFHLEVYNTGETGTYVFTIDGEVIDTGVAEGHYPTEDSAVTFGASAAIEDSITRWDYVRFGLIPIDGSGDFDSDGDLDLEDFFFFHECLSNHGPGNDTWPGCRFADMDEDGDVDAHDFAAFQLAFTGGE